MSSSLKRRLNEDEAAIATLASEVQNLKRFKVGDRTITMREVPRSGPGFPFAPPPPPPQAPRVNVNVQAPRNTYADIREGQRQAAMSNYKMSFPRVNYNPSIAVAPSRGYQSRSAFLKKKASEASIARANLSAKRGGTKIPKKIMLKALSKASIARAKRASSKGGMRPKKRDFFYSYSAAMRKKGNLTSAKMNKRIGTLLSYKSWMKQDKDRLLQAMATRTKKQIAYCLSKT